jgi:hypothetical protein
MFEKTSPEETNKLRDLCTVINDFCGPQVRAFMQTALKVDEAQLKFQ